MSPGDMNPQNALNEVSSLRARTRALRPRMSVGFMLVGVFAIGAMPFYVLRPFEEGWPETSRFASLAGYAGVKAPELTTLYWLIGVPLFYALLLWYCRWNARRSGVKINTGLWVMSGLALFAAVLICMYFPETLPLHGNLTGRGLLPLLTIAIALLLWALSARSPGAAAVAATGLAAVLVANLYNVENLLPPGSYDFRYRLVVNLALPAVVYLIGALAMEVRRNWARK